MKQIKWLWIMGVFLCVLTTAGASLEISAATDKSVYHLGETVQVFVSLYNSSSNAVTILVANPIAATYLMDDTYSWDQNKWPLIQMVFPPTSMIIEAGQTVTWQLDHGVMEDAEYFLGTGTHSVKGIVYSDATFGQYSEPVTFQIVNPEPATILLLSSGFLLLRRKK